MYILFIPLDRTLRNKVQARIHTVYSVGLYIKRNKVQA